ncbi:CoA pyrophosphatase [Teredinibacter sp. KSP-S5-2]|uniref:NUDIX hydrolase n=1 Tax=Teredinibacter sp. KSP-S5-2 TaxID=3034506 RepID=UPI0029353320|nr:CoA pyrophosphatase [Teredinibacter sp. KSP-S5-2]WNO10115.1 CoA pyrophosphatase [Teredinibacter sp. KSP-S5-2]
MKNYAGQAAVLIALCDSPDRHSGDHLLLTLRARHLNLHSGEVAFPGGKWEEGDIDLQATALRESYEEVGLRQESLEVIDQLPVAYTRKGMCVTPFAARVTEYHPLEANSDELDDLFWVPVEHFIEDRRVKTDVFRIQQRTYWAPVYEYGGYTIWGFTARVLVEFVNRHYNAGVTRQHTSPEVLWA